VFIFFDTKVDTKTVFAKIGNRFKPLILLAFRAILRKQITGIEPASEVLQTRINTRFLEIDFDNL
jgi:hypothetical protein